MSLLYDWIVPSLKRPDWANAIQERRKFLDLKQEQVAGFSGDVVSQGTVSDVERGKVNPLSLEANKFFGLIRALQWTLSDFSEATGLEIPLSHYALQYQNEGEYIAPFDRAIPVGFRRVQVTGADGSKPLNYSEMIIKDIDYRPGCRAFVVMGDSMKNGGQDSIEDGDTVLVDTRVLDLKEGGIFVFEVIGDGFTVKRARKFGGEWWMVPSNSNPRFRSFKGSEVVVIGRVYKVIPASRPVR